MKGRFAPSPTGYMHLGNLWVALLSYVSVKRQKGTYLLRIEDIDKSRSRHIYKEALLDDLEWLGLWWDEGPRCSKDEAMYYQSNRYSIYEGYVEQLLRENKAYVCHCTRSRLKEIYSAPHRGDHLPSYDGHCRDRAYPISQEKIYAIRLRSEREEGTFRDFYQGLSDYGIEAGYDDIVIGKTNGDVAYHLAVVLDDALMGVTEVLRGEDLFAFTPAQIHLHHQLGLPIPSYGHVPLLIDGEGYRLSKRQKSITVREMKEKGYEAQQILAYLVKETGLIEEKYIHSRFGISLDDIVDRYDEKIIEGVKSITLTEFDN